MVFRDRQKQLKRRRRTTFFAASLVLLALLAVAILIVRQEYEISLRPVSNDQTAKIIDIKSGSSLSQIADLLKRNGLIRNKLVFEEYVNNHNERKNLEAGTYSLSPSLSVSQIVNILTTGQVSTKLVTILPDRRMDQIKSDLINDGFSPDQVDAALKPGQYSDLPVLALKPASVNTLEGLLYPDSFQKTPNLSPAVIIRESLTEMNQHLTPAILAAFKQETLTPYQGITLASIVNDEVSKSTDEAQVAQVFLSRLSNNMKIESNVTAYYGDVLAGQPKTITYDTPYNTYLHTGLPPNPISNVNDDSLNAVAHPANTTWVYFVTGKDGVTRFATTIDQQNANIAQYGQAQQ